MTERRWRNWAGNQTCVPASLEHPASEAELVELVHRSRAAGRVVRAVGAGHSFTPAVLTDGTLVDLAGHRDLLRVDREAQQVEVEAGITLGHLNDLLADNGLALPNLGDIAYQSIAGATQTATHGTGLHFRNISSAIVGMRLVDGNGEVVACDAETNAAAFHERGRPSEPSGSCRP